MQCMQRHIELARLNHVNKTDYQYHTNQNIADLAANVMLGMRKGTVRIVDGK